MFLPLYKTTVCGMMFALASLLSLAPNLLGADKPAMSIAKKEFGKTPDGRAVQEFTLQNKQGLRVKLITWGATVTSVWPTSRSAFLISQDTRSGIPTSAAPSAGMATASPRGSSRSMATSIRWRPTTAPITCTAARWVLMRSCGMPSKSTRRIP
jgi:hypothetical protein